MFKELSSINQEAWVLKMKYALFLFSAAINDICF